MRLRWLVLVLGALFLSSAVGHPLLAEAPPEGAVPLALAQRQASLRSFTLAATGDVLTESAVLNAGRRFAEGTEARYDFSPLFAPVAPIISGAELAICHMELPIGVPDARDGVFGRSAFGGNLLLAPNEIAVSLRQAGFDRCSTASNHSNDLGPPGIDSTLEALDSVGLGHSGTARTPEESIPETFVVNGISVAHLAYTRMSNTVRPKEPWRLNFASEAQQVIDEIRRVRGAGAEVVILSVHISLELQRSPSGRDRQFISDITAATPVDVVIEHGPHVIQPIEQVNGAWVFWSVGNFVSGMGLPGATRYGPPTLDGLLAWARVVERAPGSFEVTPSSVLLCSEQFGRVVYPAMVTLTELFLEPTLRRQLDACVARTLPVVSTVE